MTYTYIGCNDAMYFSYPIFQYFFRQIDRLSIVQLQSVIHEFQLRNLQNTF